MSLKSTMYRTSITEAVVLRKVRVGEIHKSLTLLSADKGLVGVMAHGAFKIRSRLRTASEPFNVIRAYLYHDPVRNQYKLTDVESLDPLEGIHRSVERYYAASLWAEVTIRSYGAGESFPALYALLREALGLLDRAAGETTVRLSCQFLFRFLQLLGQRPELDSCGRCGAALDVGSGTSGISSAYLSRQDGTLLCGRCAEPGALRLPAGARRYLLATLSLPLGEALPIGLARESLRALRESAHFLVQWVLETRLNSLSSGVGVL